MAQRQGDGDPAEPGTGLGAAAAGDEGAERACPDPAPRMVFAVHTVTCTYLLDELGVCHWIVARHGAVPPHVRQCVGAQFVACLDLSAEGGLVAQLRPGAMALFVRTTEDGRLVLLRTAPIQRLDGVDGAELERAGAQPAVPFGDLAAQAGVLYGKKAGVPVGEVVPGLSAVGYWGTEQTVTVTRPSSSRGGPPRRDGA